MATLHWWCLLEMQVRSFRFLTEIGANMNIHNTKYDTDIHLTTEKNCVNIVKVLWGEEIDKHIWLFTSTYFSWSWQTVCKDSFCGKRCYFKQHQHLCWPSTDPARITWQTGVVHFLTVLGADFNSRSSKNITALQRLFVWILSSYYWIKECLLTWPTQMTLHRYSFPLNLAIWVQRMLFSKEVLL